MRTPPRRYSFRVITEGNLYVYVYLYSEGHERTGAYLNFDFNVDRSESGYATGYRLPL